MFNVSTGRGMNANDAKSPQGPKGIFLNISNHPLAFWSDSQRQAAEELAERIVDIPFPQVPPEDGPEAIEILAQELYDRLPADARHALVAGEFCLTVSLVRRLQARGVCCYSTTNVRDTDHQGEGIKVSRFRFVRFRAYPNIAGG